MSNWSQYEEKSNVPITDVGAKRQSQMKAAKTFMTNIGRGATLGLAKYPAAGVQMGLRALTGASVGTFGENVADVAEFYRQQEQESPQAALAGRIVGGLAATPGGGGSLAGIVGRTALAGGVSGFTENENLRDAATGAAIGALTAGTLGTGSKLIGQIVSKAEQRVMKEYKKDWAKLPLSAKKTIKEDIEFSKNPSFAADYPSITSPKQLQKAPTADELKTYYNFYNRSANEFGLPATPSVSMIRDPAARGTATTLKELAGAGSGAGIGALGGTIFGVDPMAAAAFGLLGQQQLTGYGLGRNIGREAALALGERSLRGQMQPGRVAETLARGTTMAVTPAVVQPQVPNMYEQYLEQQSAPSIPVEDNRTRLQRLADEARARFQGLQ